MQIITCCKDCPDRQIECHSSCEAYKAEKAAYAHWKAIKTRKERTEYDIKATMFKHKRKNWNSGGK